MSDETDKPSFYEITLKIARFDPDEKRSWIQDYRVRAGRILRFVDILRAINREQDSTLTWSSSCEHGQCGSCSVKVNGKALLACELLVEDAVGYFDTTVFHVEPIGVAPVMRDLVVDLERAYARVDQAKPYLIAPVGRETEGALSRLTPQEMEGYVKATRCINCFCCAGACISSHKSFLGPNAMLAAIVRVMDPRESAKEERLRLIFSDRGVYRCHTAQACSFVCPKEIDVAHFMALAKRGRITQ